MTDDQYLDELDAERLLWTIGDERSDEERAEWWAWEVWTDNYERWLDRVA